MSVELDRAVRTAALALPSVTTSIACPGTSMEALTYCAGKKNFAFVAGDTVRLKVGASAADVAKVGTVGAGGWAKVTVVSGAAVPAQLASWIAESYTLVVGATGPKKAKAKKPSAKKPSARTRSKAR